MARKIAIIGGGIAGLSAGCYGRMNGYETEIFEMHNVPGGVCTGWTRKGLHLRRLPALSRGHGARASSMLPHVGRAGRAGRQKRVSTTRCSATWCCPAARGSCSTATWTGSSAHLKEALALSPRDAKRLDELVSDVRLWTSLSSRMGSAKPPAQKLGGPLARLRSMWKIRPYLPMFKRFGASIEQYAARYRHPDLRAFFELALPIPGMPAMSLLMLLSVLHGKQAGWPEGGSLALARAIWKRYTDLGGVVHYGAQVDEIIVRDGKAVGVRLVDGTEHYADEVISAADGRATLFGMLKGRYLTPGLDDVYKTLPLYTPIVQVSYGLHGTFRCPSFRVFGRSGLPGPWRSAGRRCRSFSSTTIPLTRQWPLWARLP